MEAYDLIVIGAGPGGYEAALEGAALGMKTALVEREKLGGTCLNRGCIPTKTLLHSGDLYRELKESARFGITAGQAEIDLGAVQERKREVLDTLREGIAGRLKKAKVQVYSGTGTLEADRTVRVNGEEETLLQGKHILLATGAVPAVPPIPGAQLPGVYTSDGLLDYSGPVPETLLIIGGGVIGMEFTSFFQSLGTRVVVLEALDRILANMDKELGQSLKMLVKKRGGEVHTGARVKRLEPAENGKISCLYAEKEKQQCLEADMVLLAAGRRPCTEGLFGAAQPAVERGRILVNDEFQTSIPGVYAIGDVTGGIQLAHAATAQGVSLVRRLAGETGGINLGLIPSCVYTSPEIACVGLTAEEGKQLGKNLDSRKYPMSANGKSVLTGQERGLIKVVFDKETRKIAGAQMMCARATDMISEFAVAIAEGITLEEMAAIIRPHPTFSEGITEAVR